MPLWEGATRIRCRDRSRLALEQLKAQLTGPTSAGCAMRFIDNDELCRSGETRPRLPLFDVVGGDNGVWVALKDELRQVSRPRCSAREDQRCIQMEIACAASAAIARPVDNKTAKR